MSTPHPVVALMDEIRICENAIQAALQRLHDETGFTPARVGFDRVDVTSHDDAFKRVRISDILITLETPPRV